MACPSKTWHCCLELVLWVVSMFHVPMMEVAWMLFWTAVLAPSIPFTSWPLPTHVSRISRAYTSAPGLSQPTVQPVEALPRTFPLLCTLLYLFCHPEHELQLPAVGFLQSFILQWHLMFCKRLASCLTLAPELASDSCKSWAGVLHTYWGIRRQLLHCSVAGKWRGEVHLATYHPRHQKKALHYQRRFFGEVWWCHGGWSRDPVRFCSKRKSRKVHTWEVDSCQLFCKMSLNFCHMFLA